MSGFDDSIGARARSWSKGAEALEPKRHKVRGSSFSRPRGDSISGRLRSASDLCDSGLISREDKGTLKDLIIQDHPDLGHAFDEIEKGNPDTLRQLMQQTKDSNTSQQGLSSLVNELSFDGLGMGSMDFKPFAGDRKARPSTHSIDYGRWRLESFGADFDVTAAGKYGNTSAQATYETPLFNLDSIPFDVPIEVADASLSAPGHPDVTESSSGTMHSPSVDFLASRQHIPFPTSDSLHPASRNSGRASRVSMDMHRLDHQVPRFRGDSMDQKPLNLNDYEFGQPSDLDSHRTSSPTVPSPHTAHHHSTGPSTSDALRARLDSRAGFGRRNRGSVSGSFCFPGDAFAGESFDFSAMPVASHNRGSIGGLPGLGLSGGGGGGNTGGGVGSSGGMSSGHRHSRDRSPTDIFGFSSPSLPPQGHSTPQLDSAKPPSPVPLNSLPGSKAIYVTRSQPSLNMPAHHGSIHSAADKPSNINTRGAGSSNGGGSGSGATGSASATTPRMTRSEIHRAKEASSAQNNWASRAISQGVGRSNQPTPRATSDRRQPSVPGVSEPHRDMAAMRHNPNLSMPGLRHTTTSAGVVSQPGGLNPAGTPSGNPGARQIGAYSPESRIRRIQRFMEKREKRVWTKRVKYNVRKNFADSRLRVKGRFVKKDDEELLREVMQMT